MSYENPEATKWRAMVGIASVIGGAIALSVWGWASMYTPPNPAAGINIERVKQLESYVSQVDRRVQSLESFCNDLKVAIDIKRKTEP